MYRSMPEMSTILQTANETNPTTTNEVPKWIGIYRAKCVDNKDPSKQGRVKVWIPELMLQTVSENDGVWIRSASSTYAGNKPSGSNGVDDCGSTSIPVVGSFVFVFFEQGDPNKGWYFAGANFDNSIPTELQYGSQYYNKSVIEKRPSGRLIMISDDPSDAGIILRGKDHSKGSRGVKSPLRNSGSQQIVMQESAAGSFIRINDAAGDYIHMGGGTITLHVAGGATIVLSGANINLN